VTDLPAWITAIGTLGAFGVALVVLGVQAWDHYREAKDRRMAQARLVAAWLDNIGPKSTEDDQVIVPLVILVRNGSSEPVYDVAVKVDVGVRGAFVRSPGTVGPGETREFVIESPGFPRGVPNTQIVFVDSAGQRWRRDGQTGRLTTVRGLGEILQESAGAYMSEHPTLGRGHSLEAQHGRRIPD
jgi:hypothetical protein